MELYRDASLLIRTRFRTRWLLVRGTAEPCGALSGAPGVQETRVILARITRVAQAVDKIGDDLSISDALPSLREAVATVQAAWTEVRTVTACP